MLYLDFTVFFSPNILTLFQDSFQNITLHLTIISLQFSLVYDRSSIYSFFMTFDILGVLVRYFPCSGFDAVRTDKGKPHGHDLKRPAGGVCMPTTLSVAAPTARKRQTPCTSYYFGPLPSRRREEFSAFPSNSPVDERLLQLSQ